MHDGQRLLTKAVKERRNSIHNAQGSNVLPYVRLFSMQHNIQIY